MAVSVRLNPWSEASFRRVLRLIPEPADLIRLGLRAAEDPRGHEVISEVLVRVPNRYVFFVSRRVSARWAESVGGVERDVADGITEGLGEGLIPRSDISVEIREAGAYDDWTIGVRSWIGDAALTSPDLSNAPDPHRFRGLARFGAWAAARRPAKRHAAALGMALILGWPAGLPAEGREWFGTRARIVQLFLATSGQPPTVGELEAVVPFDGDRLPIAVRAFVAFVKYTGQPPTAVQLRAVMNTGLPANEVEGMIRWSCQAAMARASRENAARREVELRGDSAFYQARFDGSPNDLRERWTDDAERASIAIEQARLRLTVQSGGSANVYFTNALRRSFIAEGAFSAKGNVAVVFYVTAGPASARDSSSIWIRFEPRQGWAKWTFVDRRGQTDVETDIAQGCPVADFSNGREVTWQLIVEDQRAVLLIDRREVGAYALPGALTPARARFGVFVAGEGTVDVTAARLRTLR